MVKKFYSLLFVFVWFSQISFAILPTPLITAPLDASSDNPANTLINWYSVTGATSYEFKIDSNAAFTSTVIQSSVASQFACSNLAYGTTYYWQVRALKTTGILDSSNWTQLFSFSTLAALNATAPLNGALNQYPKCFLNWSSTSGITQYEVQLDESNSFNSPTLFDSILPDSISQLYATNLKFGKVYFWRVRAMHPLDTTAWNQPFNFTTLDSVTLSAPTNGASFLSTSALLNWDYVSGIVNYEVQIDKTANFNSGALQSSILPDSISQWTPATLEFGTNYFWRVRTWHAVDTSEWSQVWTFSTVVGLTLSAPANNSINNTPNVTLNWNYLSGPISYDCELDTTPNFNSPLYLYTTNDSISEFITSSLLFGTKYFWRARAHNPVDTSQWTTIWTFTTLDQLNQTSPLDGSINSASRVTLNWSAVSGLTGYDIRIDTTAAYGSPISIYTSSTTSSQLFSNLYFGTTYYWSVRAHHSADTSSWSNNWTFSTTNEVLLTSPLQNFVGASPRTNLNWSTLSGSSQYIVQYDTSSGFSSPVLISAPTTVSNFFTSNLFFNQTYYWRVKAVNLVDTSGWSAVWTFTTLNQLTHTSPLDGATNQTLATQLNWTGVSGALGYLYRYDTSPLFTSPQSGNSTGTNSRANITLPLYGQTYYWQVAVIDSVDTSGWSNPWSFTTLYQIATVPVLISPLDSSQSVSIAPVTFVWNQLDSLLSYELSYSTSPLFTNAVVTSTADTFGISGSLNYFTTYYWRVRAYNASGFSAWSSVYSFTTENPLVTAPLLISPANASVNLTSPVSFTWNSIALANSFECEYSIDSLFTSATTLISVDTFALSQPLLPLTNYFWRVRGLYGNSSSPWSTVWQFSTANPFVVAPTLISPSNQSLSLNSPVNFVWNSLAPASSYECEYAEDSLFTSSVTLIANDTTTVSLALNNLTRYYWRVRGVFYSAHSPWSSKWSFVTKDAFVPNLLYPADGDTGIASTVIFNWSIVSIATGYECQYSTDSLFNNAVTLVSSVDTLQSLTLAPFTKYFWRVRAADGIQFYSWSPIWHFTTSVMIGISPSVGISGFSIYPNPTNGRIYFSNTNKVHVAQNLQLYASDGNLVWEAKLTGDAMQSIDLSSFPKGIYSLKVSTKEAILVKRIALQ